MNIILKTKDKKKSEEKIQKSLNILLKVGTTINWAVIVFLALLTMIMLTSKPPITASSEDISVYRLCNTLPFLFFIIIAFLQLKHRDLLPLFKDRSVVKSIIAWVIVFFVGVFFSITFDTFALDSLYSEDYRERYIIYQQAQREVEDLEEQKRLVKEHEDFDNKKQTSKQNNVSTVVRNDIEKDAFTIHYFDVGQADAALVQCDGHYMLIDGGKKEDSSKMYSVMKANGIKKLDIVVATHVHEDHLGGIPGALNYAKADLVLCPTKAYESEAFEDFSEIAKENGGIQVPKVGKRYLLGDAEVQILGVNSVENDENNSSIILKIAYGDTSFLFTGDAERDAEKVLIDLGKDLSSTVLKVGHHGSNTSTSYGFIRKVMPEYAVISVGDDNSYGHPDDETLETLANAEATVFRTDLQGDICCVSDGKTVTFTTDKEASQENILLSPATVQKNEAERQSALERERQQAQLNTQNKQTKSYNIIYIGNKNTGKFHYQSCSTLPKEKNRIYFNSREEAVNYGYDPCGRCHP